MSVCVCVCLCVSVCVTETHLLTHKQATHNEGEKPGFLQGSADTFQGMWVCGFLVLNSEFSVLIWALIAVLFVVLALLLFFIFYFLFLIFFVFAAWG